MVRNLVFTFYEQHRGKGEFVDAGPTPGPPGGVCYPLGGRQMAAHAAVHIPVAEALYVRVAKLITGTHWGYSLLLAY